MATEMKGTPKEKPYGGIVHDSHTGQDYLCVYRPGGGCSNIDCQFCPFQRDPNDPEHMK